MEDLPTDYDAIVVGTGMTESIIAAALSRIGKSVLHLDYNEYYGENWASFNLESMETWIGSMKNFVENSNSLENSSQFINENENVIKSHLRSHVWNIQENWFCPEKKDNEEVQNEENEDTEKCLEKVIKNEKKFNWTVEQIKKEYRKFNLDLSPKMLFSRGLLVELLISSNIARYADFKSVNRVLTWRDGRLEPVPCSRADVFATKNVSVVEKRMLVKILTLFTEYPANAEEFQGFENKTFFDYLKHKKLQDNLIHYILYAIGMGTKNMPCIEGVKRSKAFLESLGRYGNTPFIFPMYGSGELPQCFCRLCAVFGGVYHLKRGIEALITKENECVGIISNHQRLNTKNLVLSSRCAPQEFLEDSGYDNISRGIFIIDKPILISDKEPLTLLQFPPVPQVSENLVTVIELGPGSHACPENLFVLHMTTKMVKDASSDLKHVVDALLDSKNAISNDEEQKPEILWSLTWNASQGSDKTSENCPSNVKICSGPDLGLDFDFAINQAKRIFQELFPDEEFLPRAPDPDEIVLDDVDNNNPDTSKTENENYSQDSNEEHESRQSDS